MVQKANYKKHLSALERAMAQLLQNQALLAAQQAQFAAQHEILEKESIALEQKLAERFVRIEKLLLRRGRMLKELPAAVCRKIRGSRR